MEKTFKTRLNKDDKNAVETKAILDFTGVTDEELHELASATVVINQQAIYRTSGVIPATDTIKVREQLDRPRGGGFKMTPESLAAKAEKEPEFYRSTLVALGLPEQQVNKMVSKKFPDYKPA